MTGAGPLPLLGIYAVVTRPREQAGEWSRRLAGAGAIVVEAPVTSIVPPADWAPVDRALRDIAAYDWVLVTSANGAGAVVSRARELGIAPAAMAGPRWGVVGPATAAALAAAGLPAACEPAERTGEALARAVVASGGVAGRRVLAAQAEEADERLTSALEAAGARVDRVAVYRSAVHDGARELCRSIVGRPGTWWLTFAAGSACRAFMDLAGAGDVRAWIRRGGVRVAAIGPATAEAVRRAGLAVDVAPAAADAEALVAGMAAFEAARAAGGETRESFADPAKPK